MILFPKDNDLALFGVYHSTFIFDVRMNLSDCFNRHGTIHSSSLPHCWWFFVYVAAPIFGHPCDVLTVFHTLICFSCLIISHGDFCVLGLTDARLHCCLCLMSVAAWCPVVWIDHCFFICSSLVDWSRMYKFGN